MLVLSLGWWFAFWFSLQSLWLLFSSFESIKGRLKVSRQKYTVSGSYFFFVSDADGVELDGNRYFIFSCFNVLLLYYFVFCFTMILGYICVSCSGRRMVDANDDPVQYGMLFSHQIVLYM